jgi:hypothetical protein
MDHDGWYTIASLDSKTNQLVAQNHQGQSFMLLNARLSSDAGLTFVTPLLR